ncbi:hypothetical protein H8E65_06185 [Candidatus Bathyarchaeota archaeon]|nr:hypothetical protein [Candidatus Bathyarchaeota archaeon]MBL7079116.1 hypothetical protein [Candidatus Bathyarchaeota archaeon]
MENELHKMVDRSIKDPITAILLKNSNLTVIQYESLLIDYFTDNMTNNIITYENKAIYRSKKVSRGSFSRTLSQARRNIISSIYTILLLSYVGIYDTYPFDEYKNLAEKLSEYTSMIQDQDSLESRSRIRRLEVELANGIRSLAEPKQLKRV